MIKSKDIYNVTLDFYSIFFCGLTIGLNQESDLN